MASIFSRLFGTNQNSNQNAAHSRRNVSKSNGSLKSSFRRLTLEPLEERALLAVMAGFKGTTPEVKSTIVTTANDVVADDGLISLREAISYAGTGDLGSDITFDSKVFAATQTITLDSTLGTLVIDKNLTIDGAGKVILDGGNTFTSGVSNNDGVQIMNIAEGKIVALNGLTLQHGYSQEGGAVYNYGKLTVTNCTFSGNTATDGGAVFLYDYRELTAANCTFSGNSAEERGAAIYSPSYSYTNLANCLVLDEVYVGSSRINLYYCVYNTVLGVPDWRTTTHCVSGKTAADVLESTTLNADGTFHIKADGAAANSGTKLQNDGSGNLQYWDKNAETPAWVNVNVTTPFTTAQLQVDQLSVSRLGNAANYDIYATEAYFAEAATETPSVIVTTTDDVVDPYDGLISFREAVEKYSETGDTITFTGENGTLSVDRAVTINKNLTLGDGFSLYTNDANNVLFTIDEPEASYQLTFRNVSVQSGEIRLGSLGTVGVDSGKTLKLGETAAVTLEYDTLSNSGTLEIMNNLDHQSENTDFGNVVYSYTDAQVLAGTYNNLTLSGSGEMNADGNVTVTGKLTVHTGAAFDIAGDLAVGSAAREPAVNIANNGSISLSGDFTYIGADTSFGNFTYKANDGKIAAGEYGDLTVSGDCTRTLSGKVTVSNALNLTGSKGVDESDSILTLDGNNKTLIVDAGKILASYATINNVNFTTAQTVSDWNGNTNTLTGSGNTNLTINLGGTFSAAVTNTLVYGQTLKDDAEITVTYSLRGQDATLSGGTNNDTIYDAGEQTATVDVSAAGYKFSGETTFTASSLAFTVNPKEVTVDWAGDTGTYTYDGTDQGDGVSASYTDIENNKIDLSVAFGEPNTIFKFAGSYTATASMTTQDANYTLTDATRSLTMNKKQLTVSGSTASDKVYNGTLDAAVTVGTVSGNNSGDDVTVTASGLFIDAEVGKDKNVTASYALSGTDTANYLAPANETLIASIAEAPSVVVTTDSDVVDLYDGVTSLREAIAYAGTGTLGSVITFSDTVDWRATAIELTQGQLVINKALTIQGNGPDWECITIDAKGMGRIFFISDDQDTACEVNLTGLNLSGGYHEVGGAIYNINEELNLRDITFTGNYAGEGGAIYNCDYGTLTILDSAFTSNGADFAGGAIYNLGYLSLTDTSLSGNISKSGGAVYCAGSPLSVTKSFFTANYAENNGGAIALDTAPDTGVVAVSIDDSYFIENTAGGNGGAIYSDSQTNGKLDVAVVNCVIHSNIAANGGGIYNTGANVKTTVVNSTVSLNSGTQIINNMGNLYLINGVVVNKVGATDTEIYNVGNIYLYGVVTGKIIGAYTEWGLTTGAKAEDVFVSTDPDRTDLVIKTSGPAATNGTLAGNILVISPSMGNGDFYYLRDDTWTKAGDDSVTYAFDPTNADGNYGLGSNDEGGAIKEAYVTALNKDKWGTPVSRVVTTDFFNAGAYALEFIDLTEPTLSLESADEKSITVSWAVGVNEPATYTLSVYSDDTRTNLLYQRAGLTKTDAALFSIDHLASGVALSESTRYYLVVDALPGEESIYLPASSAAWFATLGTVAKPTITVGPSDTQAIQFSWNTQINGATDTRIDHWNIQVTRGIEIAYEEDVEAKDAAKANDYTVENLSAGEIYTVTVTAVVGDSYKNEAVSTMESVQIATDATQQMPPALYNVSAICDTNGATGKLDFSWMAIDGAASYTVRVYEICGTASTLVYSNVNAAGTHLTVTESNNPDYKFGPNLPQGGEYSIEIFANLPEVTDPPKGTALVFLGSLKPKASSAWNMDEERPEIKVSWSAVENAHSYNVVLYADADATQIVLAKSEVSDTSITFDGLNSDEKFAPGIEYFVRIEANIKSGLLDYSLLADPFLTVKTADKPEEIIVGRKAETNFKLDATDTKYTLTGYIDNPDEITFTQSGEIPSGGILIFGDSGRAETLTVTGNAVSLLNRIYFSNKGDSTSLRDTLIIQGGTDGQTFTFDSLGTVVDLNGTTNSSPGTGSVLVQNDGSLGAQIGYSGIKNVFVQSNGNDTFQINELVSNINLNLTDPAIHGQTIDFSGLNVKNTSGVVLNMDSMWHQAAVVGQSGTLRTCGGTIGTVILSGGADTVAGSVMGTDFIDRSHSSNVVTLKGGNNMVEFNGTSTIVAVEQTQKNVIHINNADNSVINLSKSDGDNDVALIGANVVVNGGSGNDTVQVTGDYALVNMTQGGNDTVRVVGNNASISCGTGNDTVSLIGSNSYVSCGAGGDKIYLEDGTSVSTGNTINAGAGDDLVIAVYASGVNTFFAGGGNDLILGGSGNDTIYGNSGNNFLFGSRGADKIFGGTGRDVLVANRTTKLGTILDQTKSREEIYDALANFYADLKLAWSENNDLDATLELLGTSDLPDGANDSLKRGGGERNLFFETIGSKETDIDDALDVDLVY